MIHIIFIWEIMFNKYVDTHTKPIRYTIFGTFPYMLYSVGSSTRFGLCFGRICYGIVFIASLLNTGFYEEPPRCIFLGNLQGWSSSMIRCYHRQLKLPYVVAYQFHDPPVNVKQDGLINYSARVGFVRTEMTSNFYVIACQMQFAPWHQAVSPMFQYRNILSTERLPTVGTQDTCNFVFIMGKRRAKWHDRFRAFSHFKWWFLTET